MNDKASYIYGSILRLLIPPKYQFIDEWARDNIIIPSDNAEPGHYNPDRAVYQKEILKAASPQDPCKEIILVFGSQMGKTLIELIIMMYYIQAYPRPQAFGFSNERLAKDFVKQKLNPMLLANPAINELLGKGMKTSGDTLNLKEYAGGSLRIIPANLEQYLRSYSIAVGIIDEDDTLPKTVAKSGDPNDLFRDRFQTFEESRKTIFSSTPQNFNSKILAELKTSTYEKLFVPCPHCHELMTLEWEYMRWETNATKTMATNVWMECPHCHGTIKNSDKFFMLSTDNGAVWKATNPDSTPTKRGFFINSLYAPVGWRSWQTIVQKYIDALNAEEMKEAKIISFYNSILCRQYKSTEMDMPQPEDIAAYASESHYQTGKVPSWVLVITTGTDVQKTRLETTVMGWGKRGRNIVIEHDVFFLEPGEEIIDLESTPWKKYEEYILNGTWEREDGFIMDSKGNGLDRSYESSTIDTFVINTESPSLYAIRGIDRPTTTKTLTPDRRFSHKEAKAVYYNTPVSEYKRKVFADIKRTLTSVRQNTECYGRCEFPCDLPYEYYEQLTAEHPEIDGVTQQIIWVKHRDRNETLDTRVYATAAFYISNFNLLTDESWDAIYANQVKQIRSIKDAPKKAMNVTQQIGRRIISKGLL